jgi:hypothetical protein
MEKRGVGAIFCLVAAILFSTRYIAAVLFMSNVTSWNSELFASGLECVGSPLLVLSIISVLIGFGYLVWADYREKK